MAPLLFLLACADPAPPPAPPVATPAPAPEAPVSEAPTRETPNRPPKISRLALTPGSPTVVDAITAAVETSDPDGQPIDLDFTWTISGREVIGLASERLEPGKFVKGDQIKVVVKATDGIEDVTMESGTVTVANTAPSLDHTPGPGDRLDGFHFQAHDVDGDPITWRLEDAPAGMTIDSMGYVHYAGSADEKGGDYRVKVVAEDGETWTKFEIPLSVSAGSKAVADAKKAAEEAAKAAEAEKAARR